jgi:hypothetical protein
VIAFIARARECTLRRNEQRLDGSNYFVADQRAFGDVSHASANAGGKPDEPLRRWQQ